MNKKNIHKKRAALYARFSPGPNQREESITGQMRENQLYCDKNDFVVVAQYADRSISGRSDDRPQFQQMISDAEKGLFDVIICYKTDRFARDRFDAAVYKNKLKKFGVRVLYSKMSIPEGPEGIILESVLEGLDEYYSKDLAQKILRGLYDNALEGKSTGSPTPFGYKVIDKKYTIDKDKAPIVQEIFTRYAAGELIVSIIDDLNERGIRTQRGNVFNKNSLHRMFKNEKYIGIYRHKSTDENFEDVVLYDVIPPIIDEHLFTKVQKRLELNYHHKKRAALYSPTEKTKLLQNVDFILSGKIFDKDCGGYYVGDSGQSKSGTYYYYTCVNKKARKGCHSKSYRKEVFENVVFEKLQKNVLNDRMIDYISEQIDKIQSAKQDNNSLKLLEKNILEIKKSIKNILTAIENGIYTETTKQRLLELEDQQFKLESEIKFEKCRLNAPKLSKERVIFFLKSLTANCEDNELLKKQILSDFVDAVVMDNKNEKMIISCRFNGDDVFEADFKALKNAIGLFDCVSNGGAFDTISELFANKYFYDVSAQKLFVLCAAA